MRVVIIGAGGHAQVVVDILKHTYVEDGQFELVGYLDDNPAMFGRQIMGLPVLGALRTLHHFPHEAVVVAVGNNRTRSEIFQRLQEKGESFVTACHAKAVIAPTATLGPGCMVSAGVLVSPGASIGANTILNTGCTVDHHDRISQHVHIAPGSHLGGNVTVGEGALIGIGATVMPQRTVGKWAVIGAGACVVDDVPDGTTVVGVPAKPLIR